MVSTQSPADLGDYSPEVTLIQFDHPIPLLRWPIKASPLDDPESGPFLLAFKDPRSWALAYKTCESLVTKQCEDGARIGCSISASSKCQLPWWKTLLGLSKQDYAERAKCEDLEMEACVVAANVKCREFAKDKCLKSFREAKIACKDVNLTVKKKRSELAKVISWACSRREYSELIEISKPGKPWTEFKRQFEVSCCKGSDLLGPDSDYDVDLYLRK